MSIQKQVKINNASVEQAGLSRDFSADIAEFIWNGFDAGASEVRIAYIINEIKGVESLSIEDNGEGIDYSTIEKTFGILLDSSKSSLAGSSSYVHGKRGIGRFSFKYFAHIAEWISVFKKDNKKYRFSIKISADNKEKYSISDDLEDVKDVDISTGCRVNFSVLNDSSVNELVTPSFIESLRREFGWYLHLNKERGFKLFINDKVLDYESSIIDSDEKKVKISHGKESYIFGLNYIEWKKNTGDDYYYNYFLDTNYIEKGKKTTSFNKNGINFHHSVYIVSSFFENYSPSSNKQENKSSLFEDDFIFKELNKELHLFLQEKQKKFINRNAEILIQELEQEKVFPEFENNELGEDRKREFVNLTKSLYRLEPKLFIKVSPLQKRSFLSFLKLSIDSNERENVVKIIESIVDMTAEERAELAKILQVTTLSNIVYVMKDIVGRIKNVEILKSLVNDFEKYTNERDNIQKIMEKCFWLFGEQYTVVSSDKSFTSALQKYYIDILNEDLSHELKLSLDHKDSKKRPDLFLCRQYPLTQTPTRLSEDNIIIELKRPSVDIGITQMRQLEDYMDFIVKSSNFSGTIRNWKFYIVGKNLTGEVQARVDENKNKGEEQFLYLRIKNFAIYALNWDDLFQSFKLKAGFILSKLDIKTEVIIDELKKENISPAGMPDYLTKIVSNEKSVSSPPANPM